VVSAFNSKKMITSQNYQPEEGVINLLPSLTVPDQSLTLRELLVHYTRGGQLPQSQTQPAYYDENAFVPNLKKLDLVEINELHEENAKNAQDAQLRLADLKKQKEQQRINKLVEEQTKLQSLKNDKNEETSS